MKVGALLIFLCFFLQGFGYQPLNIFQARVVPTDSTEIWLKWARDSTTLSTSQKINLFDKAIDLTKKNNPDSLFEISFAALTTGDSILFKEISKEVIKLSKALGQKESHGLAHWDLADFYKKAKPDSAYYHLQEAYGIFSNMEELDASISHYPGAILLDIGNLKDAIKDYVGAEKDIIEAIDYFNKVETRDRLFVTYNSLGIAQNGLNKFDKALEYHQKAKSYIRYARSNRKYRYELMNENNIAFIYLRKGDFKKAYELYSALEQKDSLLLKNPELYAKVLSSRTFADFKSGAQDFEGFERAFKRSNEILDSIGDTYSKARNYEYHAQVLAGKHDTLGAIKKALIGKDIAEETTNNDRLLSSLKLLTTLDKKNSANYAKAYFNLTEDLQQKERAIQDKFARIRMETDEIIEENEALAKQKQLYSAISLILLVLGIGIFIIVSQRISNQKLKFKQKEQNSNQEIYNLMLSQHGKLEEGKKTEKKRISEELHDGILGQMLGIRLILSGLNERADEKAIEQRAELIQKLQELEEEVRTISHELNESAYEKVHEFMISIQELIQTVKKSTEADIELDYSKSYAWDILNGDTKINIYRIVQECLQNCIKHSKCKNIQVNFKSSEKMLNLTVADDGIGFDSTKEKKGIGLKNIISRVKKIDGSLKVNSIPNKGTKINIEFPVERVDLDNPKPHISRKTVQEV
ncbi:tetratricopeptide repeat-containing sensor histidine kinase [Croceitalea rosinachiae]|uniref:histidine kinase n=1 Tax=Croceitalea rosinachiae TaxID=3075596 RepID=A0ABU3ADW9_9FLAO|nr:sensor histidine kinase [Croceitalea sp. F388]MDT0607303.1 sensor histidine kinase [Croceitalea sp. F388]